MDTHKSSGPSHREALLTFRIIGGSLGLGVTLFAFVSWFLHLEGDVARPTLDLGIMLNAMLLTVVGGAGVATVWWRARVAPLLEEAPGDDWVARANEIQSNVIIVWALVEAGALFAEVVYFLYDAVYAGLLGVVLIWSALLVTWPRREWFEGPNR